jgi:hypothetical protein
MNGYRIFGVIKANLFDQKFDLHFSNTCHILQNALLFTFKKHTENKIIILETINTF